MCHDAEQPVVGRLKSGKAVVMAARSLVVSIAVDQGALTMSRSSSSIQSDVIDLRRGRYMMISMMLEC